jgi:hypothetical protein
MTAGAVAGNMITRYRTKYRKNAVEHPSVCGGEGTSRNAAGVGGCREVEVEDHKMRKWSKCNK